MSFCSVKNLAYRTYNKSPEQLRGLLIDCWSLSDNAELMLHIRIGNLDLNKARPWSCPIRFRLFHNPNTAGGSRLWQ